MSKKNLFSRLAMELNQKIMRPVQAIRKSPLHEPVTKCCMIGMISPWFG
jgi:hypothetical protein